MFTVDSQELVLVQSDSKVDKLFWLQETLQAKFLIKKWTSLQFTNGTRQPQALYSQT